MDKGEIILYETQDNGIAIDVLVENETVWLNRQQIAVLFDRDIKTIGKHINNALKEELAVVPTVAKNAPVGVDNSVVANFATTENNSTVAKFATVQQEGNRQVLREIEYYSLDVILSVGYRVKSNQGIRFRRWANQILKDYTLRGYAISQRFERLEYRMAETEKHIGLLVKTSLTPKEGIFYDGQIFDAYIFVSDLMKSATEKIILLDNYIDETVLLLLSKRQSKVGAIIYTKQISSQLQLDLSRYNAQYEQITIYKSITFHDRFLIIDDTVYHIGASLKDLGRKLFAFSKMEIKQTELLENI